MGTFTYFLYEHALQAYTHVCHPPFKTTVAHVTLNFLCLAHGNELTGPRGEVASPLFPLSYYFPTDDDITWRITVTGTMKVAISFDVFELEPSSYSEGICVSTLKVKKTGHMN